MNVPLDQSSFGSDRYVIEVAAGQTLPLRLHVSFAISLFQYVGLRVRKLRQGAIEPGTVTRELVQLAAASPPIEILRWGEYAARDSAQVSELGPSVRTIAERWAYQLVGAMMSVADEYRRTAWSQGVYALLESQRWLATNLPAAKDKIILGLRQGLLLPHDNRPVDVTLVDMTYDVTGAHSHPVMIDVSRFAGADLVETLFHELGHELLDRSVGDAGTTIPIVNRAIGARLNHGVTVYDVLHIAIFAKVGNLVREHFDPSHNPLLYGGGRLERLLQRMRVAAAQTDVVATLDGYSSGQRDIRDLADFFVRHSAPSRRA